MPYLDDKTIREILNLQGSPLIQRSIADRQLEVIRKGFNHLSEEHNNALYIADEVGLGKTYIALGIAALLRHFSTNPEHHQDAILVPKENLQQKWRKEILQFSSFNYLVQDNRVKSVIGKPVGEIIIHDQLEAITADFPAYHLYRHTSFSFGLSMNGKNNLLEELKKYFNDKETLGYLERAWQLEYFREKNKGLLKKLCAYLMAITNPSIELLIVDEGHNFKAGPGDDDLASVAYRNAVAARFFGLKLNSEEDKIIFNDFPGLKNKIQPRVQKLLVLSATPKTYGLLELKRQLDCFLPQHILTGCKKEQEIKEKLPYLLMRGKMEYTIRDERFTRNQCRFEHRNGNANKSVEAKPIQLQEGDPALFMGLLQYNTIRHLNRNYNGHIEMGMLAGFETFRLDAQRKSKEEPEYEDTRSSRMVKSQDQEVLNHLVESWNETFGEPPPHPKQTVMVDALLEMMKKGEKALVFVRRVASAYEMEGRLMNRWEREVIAPELKNKWSKLLPSPELQALLNAHDEYIENKQLLEHLDDIYQRLTERLLKYRGEFDFGFISRIEGKAIDYQAALKTGLYHLYNQIRKIDPSGNFKDGLMRLIRVSTFKKEWLDLTHQLLKKEYRNWKDLIDDESASILPDEDETYFFHGYFQTPAGGNFKRKRIYNVDWFEPNYFLINNHFKIADYKAEPLQKANIHAKDQGEIKEVQEIFLKHISSEKFHKQDLDESLYPNMLLKPTLLTRLLIEILDEEVGLLLEDYKSESKDRIFHELRALTTILRSNIRNGSGFLPLFIAAHAKGQMEDNFIRILKDQDSVFRLVTLELKTIVKDYRLLRAVNFPENDSFGSIESKLLFQSPIKGLSGMKKNKSKWATQFRMPGFPYILITTDIFREGEDLHTYCQNIYHYGIAWNCTDMEQRTGRIDRINSLSHRKMTVNQSLEFDNRLHVFYPYIQKTIEVNQVHKLFTSINEFVKAFDIVDSISDDGQASLGEKVEHMPEVIDKPLHSQFEHHHFKSTGTVGIIQKTYSRIGLSIEDVTNSLNGILQKLNEKARYHYMPKVDFSEFCVKAVMKLEEDSDRRGPFHIKVINDRVPGKFKLEFAAYLFKQSSKIMAAIKTERLKENYKVIEVEDYFALSYKEDLIVGTKIFEFEKLYELLRYADKLERESTNFDLSVFE